MTTIGYDATPLLGQKSGVGHYTKRLIAAIMSLEPQWCYQLYTNRPLGELDEGLRRAMEIDTYLPASRWLWTVSYTHLDVYKRQALRPGLCDQ